MSELIANRLVRHARARGQRRPGRRAHGDPLGVMAATRPRAARLGHFDRRRHHHRRAGLLGCLASRSGLACFRPVVTVVLARPADDLYPDPAGRRTRRTARSRSLALRRAVVLDVAREEMGRTARAKGLPQWRNALIPDAHGCCRAVRPDAERGGRSRERRRPGRGSAASWSARSSAATTRWSRR